MLVSPVVTHKGTFEEFSGRVLDLVLKGHLLDTHRKAMCCVQDALIKIYSLLSTGSTQEDSEKSQHEKVSWDVKHQHKQI